MKYLSVNLTKHIQNLYAENYAMLMEGIKWRHTVCAWTGRLDVVKRILPRLLPRLTQSLSKL